MKDSFTAGDIVQLKSGGPKMTVEGVALNHMDKEISDVYACSWFAGLKLQKGRFSRDSLKRVEDQK